MIKRQTKIIIALIVAIAVAIPVYLFVISPLVKVDAPKKTPPPELLDGEILIGTNQIGMMDIITNKDIDKVVINNLQPEEKDSEVLTNQEIVITKRKNKEFYVKDYANAPIYASTLDEICEMLASGTTVTRVTKNCEDFTKYGFKEDKTSDYWYSVTGKDTTHKVYIGNRVPDGSGYYARYDGRDALYIQSLYIALYAMIDVYDIMTPILTTPLNETDYLPQSFTISNRENLKVDIFLQDDKQIIESGSAMRMRVKYPTEVDVSDFFIDILYNRFLKSLQGSRVVAVGKGETGNITALTPEELAEYGIYPNITPEIWQTILDAYKNVFPPEKGETSEEYEEGIRKMYEGVGVYPLDGECSAYTLSMIGSLNNAGAPNLLFFSEKQDGFYYVYSYTFDLLVEIPATTVDFLEWEATKFQASSIYQTNITNLQRIEIIGQGVDTAFDLTHKKERIDESNTQDYLTYSFIDPSGKLKKYTNAPDPNGLVDEDESKLVTNFRYLMIVLMRIYNQGELPEEVDVTDKTPYLSIKLYIKTEAGKEETRVINFFDYGTATRLKFQINGVGNSFVKRSKVDLFIECTTKVLNDIELDYYDYMGTN